MYTALLTIDDFSTRNTPAMMDYLNARGIQPIFFAEGRKVEAHYQEAVYALQNGAIVGNHSYSHPAFSSLKPEACIREIEQCERVLDQLYKDSGVERIWRPFRFPYGDKGGTNKAMIQQYLRDHGFHKVDDTRIRDSFWHEFGLDQDVDTFWTFDFAEYQIRPGSDFTVASVWDRMHDAAPQNGSVLFGEGNHHILLLHAHDETEALVPQYYKLFIDHLLENGMVFDAPRFL